MFMLNEAGYFFKSLVLGALLAVLTRLPRGLREAIMPDMLIPPIKNDPSKIQLVRLGHVIFQHPDIDAFAKFAVDFGFVIERKEADRVFFRGYGIDPFIYLAIHNPAKKPQFLGPAFVARDEAEFEKARQLEGAVESQLHDHPGGGRMVTFRRADDTQFHVIYGQEERQVASSKAPSAINEEVGPPNTPFAKPRKGLFQRYHKGPALIHKLGHFGYVCRDFDTELAWYTNNFNFVPSDILHHWDFSNLDVMTFLHLDLGKQWTDHHIMFLQRAQPEVRKTFVHHTSYEVEDFDTQLIGHEYLAEKGYESVWGVGRHVLGSQIFDYWLDPSGFKIEHYADGDLVNEDTPTKRDVVGPLSVWGPELPKDFGDDLTVVVGKLKK